MTGYQAESVGERDGRAADRQGSRVRQRREQIGAGAGRGAQVEAAAIRVGDLPDVAGAESNSAAAESVRPPHNNVAMASARQAVA